MLAIEGRDFAACAVSALHFDDRIALHVGPALAGFRSVSQDRVANDAEGDGSRNASLRPWRDVRATIKLRSNSARPPSSYLSNAPTTTHAMVATMMFATSTSNGRTLISPISGNQI
jgi:hypothetical protein